MQFLTLITTLIFVLFLYLIIVRPQRKRERHYALMVASVKPGARLYAAGGIYGEVIEVRRKSFVMVTSPSKTVLLLDSDAIEIVDGFDYKKELKRQNEARKKRNIDFRRAGKS